jgi:transcriptional regulator with XRE-family HTH domain
MAILSKEQVLQIKSDLATKNLTQKQIGKKFGVGRSVVSDIATGRVHKDVIPETELDPEQSQVLKLQGEIEHLREERNAARRDMKEAAKTQGLFAAVIDEMRKRVKPMKALPPARQSFKKEPHSITEHLVMHLSDGHHDQVITPSDTGGLETYDFPISMCRAERFVDTTIKWTQQRDPRTYSTFLFQERF